MICSIPEINSIVTSIYVYLLYEMFTFSSFYVLLLLYFNEVL